eukprot:802072_1
MARNEQVCIIDYDSVALNEYMNVQDARPNICTNLIFGCSMPLCTGNHTVPSYDYDLVDINKVTIMIVCKSQCVGFNLLQRRISYGTLVHLVVLCVGVTR